MYTLKKKVRRAVQILVDRFESDKCFRDGVVSTLTTIVGIAFQAIRKR